MYWADLYPLHWKYAPDVQSKKDPKSFSLTQPVLLVEERSRTIASGRTSFVGQDQLKRPIVVVTVENSTLDMEQEDGTDARTKYNREMKMHQKVIDVDEVSHVWPDASYVQTGSSNNTEADGDETTASSNGPGSNSAVHCTESLDQWQTLSSILRQRGPVGTKSLMPIARLWLTQIVQGLSSLHANGIVLRDVRPDNIFIRADGLKIKFGSLSLAGVVVPLKSRRGYAAQEKYVVDAPDLPTATKYTSGPYAPPEQSPLFIHTRAHTACEVEVTPSKEAVLEEWKNGESMDATIAQRVYGNGSGGRGGRATDTTYVTTSYDTWQIGCVLYEMLVGRAPPSYTSSLEEYARSRERSNGLDLILPYFDFLSSITVTASNNSNSANSANSANSSNSSTTSAAASINSSTTPNETAPNGLRLAIPNVRRGANARPLPALSVGIASMSMCGVVPHLGNQSGSGSRSARDPLSVSVADKLRKFLRLTDQGQKKNQNNDEDEADEDDDKKQDSGMQALAILRKMDSSGDGVLSKSEFRRVLIHDLHIPLTNSDIEHLMRNVDTDRDGTVQLHELERFLHETGNVSTPEQSAIDVLCMCLQPRDIFFRQHVFFVFSCTSSILFD